MEILNEFASSKWVQTTGWALMHSLWQGLVVLALAELALLAARRWSASARYAIACAALLALSLLPLATAAVLFSRQLAAPELTPPAPPLFARAAPAPELRLTAPSYAAPAAAEPAATHQDSPASPLPLERLLPALVAAWAAGVGLLSFSHLGAWLRLRRLKHQLVKPVGPALQRRFDTLCYLFGVKRTIFLLESAVVSVPTVIGWLKPAILLPVSALTGLSFLQLEAIVAHELAHIRRNDYLVNLLQIMAETLYFYHPAVWRLSSRIRAEREFCCDDLAVALCGDALTYSRALTCLEEWRCEEQTLAVAATGTGGPLMRRIRRLLPAREIQANDFNRSMCGAATLVVAVVVFGAAVALHAGQNTTASEEISSASRALAAARAQDTPTSMPQAGEQPTSASLQQTAHAAAADKPMLMVVVASRLNPETARTLVRSLQNDGYGPVQKITDTHGDRVLCGPFPTRQVAQAFMQDLKRAGYTPEGVQQLPAMPQTSQSTTATLSPPPRAGAEPTPVYSVHVATMSSEMEARQFQKALQADGYGPVRIVGEQGHFNVLLGQFATQREAEHLLQDLRASGYTNGEVQKTSASASAQGQADAIAAPWRILLELTPHEKVAQALKEQLERDGFTGAEVVPTGRGRELAVQVRCTSGTEPAALTQQLRSKGYEPKKVSSSWRVRVISNAYEKLARALERQLKRDGFADVEVTEQGGRYSVYAGHFATDMEARWAIEHMAREGLPAETVVQYGETSASLGMAALPGRPESPGMDFVIETRAEGRNNAHYQELSGKWINSGSQIGFGKSRAPGLSDPTRCGSRKVLCHDMGDSPARARFLPKLTAPAKLHVYVSWPREANATPVIYLIKHAKGTDRQLLEQDGWIGANGNRWTALGEYEFAPGEDQYVELMVPTGCAPVDRRNLGQAYADSIRFTQTPLAPTTRTLE